VADSKDEKLRDRVRRFDSLKEERNDLDKVAKDISEFITPNRGRFSGDLKKPDIKSPRGSKILDSTAADCHEIASNGLHSGLTPPSRMWFHLSFSDDYLNRLGSPTRAWLDTVQDAIRSVLRKSNFYSVIHNSYAEIVAFSTSCIRMDADPYDGLRFKSYTWGQFWIACDASGRVDTVYRLDYPTARQILQRWGDDHPGKLTNIEQAYESNPYQTFEVLHVVQPRKDRDPDKLDKKNKKYESTYILMEGDRLILEESGTNGFPYAVGRWAVIGCDNYGSEAPGMRKLPDIKGLQDIERTAVQASHREADPPMVAPSSMTHTPIRKSPGGVTFSDNADGLRRLYELDFNLEAAEMKAEQIRTRIRKGFYNDLFLAITALEQQTGNTTATAVLQMQQEKLLQLGPFIERQENEVLDPLLEFVVRHVIENPEANSIQRPPPEMQDVLSYKIEYKSLLAMAQQSTEVRVIDEALMAAGQMIQMFPEVLDNIDPDETYRARCNMTGTPAVMFRAPDAVEQIRQARKEQEAQMAQMQQGLALAKGASDVGKISMNPEDPNVVSKLIQEATQTGVV
jgi:hypothetical protein